MALISRTELCVFASASTGCRPQGLVPVSGSLRQGRQVLKGIVKTVKGQRKDNERGTANQRHSLLLIDWYVVRWTVFHGLRAAPSIRDETSCRSNPSGM